MNSIEEVKEICKILVQNAEEVQEILSTYEHSTYERDKFAIAFLNYVENTFEKKGDDYFYKTQGLNHIKRNIHEIMENYKQLREFKI